MSVWGPEGRLAPVWLWWALGRLQSWKPVPNHGVGLTRLLEDLDRYVAISGPKSHAVSAAMDQRLMALARGNVACLRAPLGSDRTDLVKRVVAILCRVEPLTPRPSVRDVEGMSFREQWGGEDWLSIARAKIPDHDLAKLLGQLGATEQLIRLGAWSDRYWRDSVGDELGKRGNPALMLGVFDRDASYSKDRTAVAFRGLLQCADLNAANAALDRVRPDDLEQCYFVSYLKDIGDGRSTPRGLAILREAMRDPRTEVWQAAASALCKQGDSGDVDAIADALPRLGNIRTGHEWSMPAFLGRHGDGRGITWLLQETRARRGSDEVLRRMLEEHRQTLPSAALRALAGLEDREEEVSVRDEWTAPWRPEDHEVTYTSTTTTVSYADVRELALAELRRRGEQA